MMDMFTEYRGCQTVTISNLGGDRRMICTSLTHSSGSCARWYNSPDELREGYIKDRWCIFDLYSPEQLIALAWPDWKGCTISGSAYGRRWACEEIIKLGNRFYDAFPKGRENVKAFEEQYLAYFNGQVARAKVKNERFWKSVRCNEFIKRCDAYYDAIQNCTHQETRVCYRDNVAVGDIVCWKEFCRVCGFMVGSGIGQYVPDGKRKATIDPATRYDGGYCLNL